MTAIDAYKAIHKALGAWVECVVVEDGFQMDPVKEAKELIEIADLMGWLEANIRALEPGYEEGKYMDCDCGGVK